MITITDRAASEVKGLLEKENKPGSMLRVFVSDGGCAGFQYGMSLEDNVMAGDTTYQVNDVKVIIDPRSGQFLEGASIDYVDDLEGGGFKIDNPNASSTCGCGGSFAAKEGVEDAAEAAAETAGAGAYHA